MKEIIWIAGASAVGKRTMIDKLLQKGSLQDRFKLWGSIVDIDCKAGDFQSTQEKIAESSAEYILIKWQYKDREGVEILKKLYPEKRHRVIGAWCPYQEHFRRYKQAHSERLETLYKKINCKQSLDEFMRREFDVDRSTNYEWLRDIYRNRRMSQIEIEFVDTSDPVYPKIDSHII